MREFYSSWDLPPRAWENPPIAVVAISIVLFVALFICGVHVMGRLENLEEIYHIKHSDMPTFFAVCVCALTPFAVAVVFTGLSWICINIRWSIHRIIDNFKTKSTYKFRDNG